MITYGAYDAVDGGLSGTVAIVEQMFGVGIVHRDDWEAQHAFLGHGAKPNHAGGGLFSSADHAFESVFPLGVQHRNQIGAVVHCDMRSVIDGGHNVAVVAFAVFTLDGEHGNVVLAHQTGGHVILRGKRIGGAKHHVGAAIPKCDRQVGSFRRDVQAGGNADSLQRLVLNEFLADDLENFH